MYTHIDYRGLPIVNNNSGNLMIDYHTQSRHPVLFFIMRIIAKHVGKTARHSHLRHT
jgi:hypothetical protein